MCGPIFKKKYTKSSLLVTGWVLMWIVPLPAPKTKFTVIKKNLKKSASTNNEGKNVLTYI